MSETSLRSRILFFSPIGSIAAGLLSPLIERFRQTGADFLLPRYEPVELTVEGEIAVELSVGGKWQLARRHLTPERCASYDFIFVWDDDLAIADFV